MDAVVKYSIKTWPVVHTRSYYYTETSARSLTLNEFRKWLQTDTALNVPKRIELDFRTLKISTNRKTGISIGSDSELRSRLLSPGNHAVTISGQPEPKPMDTVATTANAGEPAARPSSRAPASAITVRFCVPVCSFEYSILFLFRFFTFLIETCHW